MIYSDNYSNLIDIVGIKLENSKKDSAVYRSSCKFELWMEIV